MKKVLITGVTGFIGTNLALRLLKDGDEVIGVDNFSSSSKEKLRVFQGEENFKFVEFDITEKFGDWSDGVDEIYNLACPASPPRYMKIPFETIDVCTNGMINVLELARKNNAKILHTSTSEIYGDPEVHPQNEEYRGNVNTVGPRSCYDEGKRISETICYEYQDKYGVDVKIARIFNTYGPYMDPDDGRVISNFLNQAIAGEKLTIYGNGSQTRSFQYIDDLVEGLIRLMGTGQGFMGPVNLGNPEEFSILELAELVKAEYAKEIGIEFLELPKDDPTKRKPDISLAKGKLGWTPKIDLKTGLQSTFEYFKSL